jgi:hypothetical protein
MKRHGSDLNPELEAFITPCKIQREPPPELRARVLARARVTVAAGGATPRFPARDLPPAPRVRAPRGRRLVWIAFAASFAVAAGAVGAAAALYGQRARAPQIAGPERAVPGPNAPLTSVGTPASEPLAPDAEPATAKPFRPARPGAKADRFAAELDLLQRAHGAYTRRDFSAALTLIAEHARRFSHGHLAEQREALRVRSLAGSGHADEAHRAAAAFAIQFPRSVLLPRVAGGSEAAKP